MNLYRSWRAILISGLIIFTVVGDFCSADAETPTPLNRPNVVIFMADDIGLGDIGFYHRERTGLEAIVPTPHLDALILSGMRFSDAHSPSSLCAPSRFSMLTGNFSDRGPIFGVWSPEKAAGINPKYTTIARLAKAGGYKTAFFGKWGLGEVWSQHDHGYASIDRGATSFGFDYALELPKGIQNRPLAFYRNRQWMKLSESSKIVKLTREQARFNKKTGRIISPNIIGDSNWDPSIVGEILTSDAVNYIKNHDADNSDKPFFIYFNSQAVHIPHTPPDNFLGQPISGTTLGLHGDMIRELDAQVGTIITALKETGEYENTLFIFTSDNGGLNRDNALVHAGHDSSNGLRARKGSIYEGGHRVPFLAVWPGKIKAGSLSTQSIVAHDVVATMAALAGQTLNRQKILDSMNLLPLLMNREKKMVRTFLVHSSKVGPYFAIRKGKWKLIMQTDSPRNIQSLIAVALFDLESNVEEREEFNLINSKAHNDLIEDLIFQYKTHRTSMVPTVINSE